MRYWTYSYYSHDGLHFSAGQAIETMTHHDFAFPLSLHNECWKEWYFFPPSSKQKFDRFPHTPDPIFGLDLRKKNGTGRDSDYYDGHYYYYCCCCYCYYSYICCFRFFHCLQKNRYDDWYSWYWDHVQVARATLADCSFSFLYPFRSDFYASRKNKKKKEKKKKGIFFFFLGPVQLRLL